MKKVIFVVLLINKLTVYSQNTNSVLPTCPDKLLPVIDVQINNTVSNHDDYGSTLLYTVCSARVINVSDSDGANNFPGGVPVELRNPANTSKLIFSTIGDMDGGSSSIFDTLPEDGSWCTFYVKGISTDTKDKNTIIEIAAADTTCGDVVLARKALMIPNGSAPIPALEDRPRVEIEIGSVSTLDDYLTWSPKMCRVRWSNAPPSTPITFKKTFDPNSFIISYTSFIESTNSYVDSTDTALNITLRNMQATNRLRFAGDTLTGGHTAINSTLPLTLPGDGSWVYFYIAGNFNNASVSDKDAVMEIIDAGTGLLLSREGMMVRIRKNANKLTTAERDRFLGALKKLDLTYNDYIDFVKTHSRDNTGITLSKVASKQAHAGSAFLPWHRSYVLHLERLLQAVDPSVALPYWKFDTSAPNVFKPAFMGSNTSTNMVNVAATNPIVSWTLPGEGVPVGIQRKTPYGNNGHPAVASETAILALGSPTFSYSSFKSMEISFHNPAHSKSGSNSWLIAQNTSNRDPIFFLLHCNVDRLWAKWQWLNNRYINNDTVTYDLQGSFYAPAPGVLGPNASANRTLGQYADDTMWPWDNITGGSGAAARPNIAILTPLPVTLNGSLPGKKPTVKSMIDYIGITSASPGIDIGFGYDDFFPY
jgi:tyrosinase